jgi:hypothetical protein
VAKEDETEFLSLGSMILPTFEVSEDLVFFTSLQLSSRKKYIKREVYSIFGMLAATGGLLDIVERFFYVVVSFFATKQFLIHTIKADIKFRSHAGDSDADELKLQKLDINCCKLTQLQLNRICTAFFCCGRQSQLEQEDQIIMRAFKNLAHTTDIQ